MRRQLVVGAAAITATVVIAFIVPLGVAVRVLAQNRPLSAAEQTARSVATVIALTDDPDVVAQAAAAAQSQSDAAVTAFLRSGETLGAPATRTAAVDDAFRGAAFTTETPDGAAVFVPAVRADGTVAVVQAAVPNEVLRRGVVRSWLLLAGLAIALLLLAVTIADWLGRSVVKPVREVADTARRLGGGDLAARATPAGPPEIADVAGALNGLAGRITALLAAEREMVADLSHRLRTPLTALRIDADAVRDEQDRERLRADVDAVESTVTDVIRAARRPARQGPSETVDLVEVVRDRTAYWAALAEEQHREWDLIVTAETAPVQVARADAEALIDVLLDNVFTHTPEGTRYVVEVSAHALSVADDGPGFAALPSRGASSGSTGLGLDIARQTAARVGGELRIAPRQPHGARVEVTFGAAPARTR